MSETSVLLPSARIALFSTDQNTRSVAEDLSADWRFARVETDVRDTDLDGAIAYFAEHTAPDLLIIQTDTIDDGFTEKLEELAAYCDEGTDAIVIGPDNDVQLYRKLIAMGVSDYVVRPVEQEVFADVIAKTLINKLGTSGSRLIVTIGGKGGVGTSFLSQITALGLSDILGQKTLLMDGAGGWSSNSVALGAEPSTTLSEAATAAGREDKDSLRRMIVNANEKLSLLASGGDIMLEQDFSAKELEQLLSILMSEYPVVIFDASASSPELQKAALMLAHKIVVMSTPDVFALRQTRTLLQEIKGLRDTENNAALIALVLNQQGFQGKGELETKEIESMLEHELSHTIAFVPQVVSHMQNKGAEMLDETEGAALARSLLLVILKDMSGIDFQGLGDKGKGKSGGLGALLGKFKGKG